MRQGHRATREGTDREKAQMSKRKKGPVFSGRPDDSFSAAGMMMERFGRYSVARVQRTPEEQAQLEKGLWDARTGLFEKIKRANAEILEIINRYEPFAVVANLFLRNCVHNPNDYREFDSKLHPHFVEHAAILELKNGQDEKISKPIKPVEGEDLQRAQDLLEEIFNQAVWYYIGESFDPSQSGKTRLSELRFLTLLNGMVVRSPAYTQHWQAVLDGLSRCVAADQWLKANRGYRFKEAIKFANGLEVIITTLLDMRFEDARKSISDFDLEFPAFLSGKTCPADEDKKGFFEQMRGVSPRQAKEYYRFAIANWIAFGIPLVLAITPNVLAEAVQENEDVAAAFLADFSLLFGSTPEDYVLPSPYNALHERPIISSGKRYFCPAPHLLEWAVKPRLEEILVGSPAWESYNRHRAKFLIDEGMSCFQKLLPAAKIYKNLFYQLPEEGEAELDALILFDRYAFLVEGKAGSFGAARRGGKPRLLKKLTQLVGDSAAQARRAISYVIDQDKPMFRSKNGETVQVDRLLHSQLVEVSLTLDILDLYTADLFKLRDLGIVGGDELPWAVCLTDLMAISEVISRPSEFLHFLRWRRSVNQTEDVTAMTDELNWLAVYYKEGPKPPASPTGSGSLQYTSYLEGFDDYFMYSSGARTKPARRPRQDIPERFESLIDAFEASNLCGFTDATEFLYELDNDERRKLSSSLCSFRLSYKRGRATEITIQFSRKAVRLLATARRGATSAAEAARLSQGMKKDVLVAQLSYEDNLSIAEWGICRAS